MILWNDVIPYESISYNLKNLKKITRKEGKVSGCLPLALILLPAPCSLFCGRCLYVVLNVMEWIFTLAPVYGQ